MKQIAFLLLLLPLSGFAQQQPRWLDDQSREQNYPSSVFYTGFATGSIRAGENKQTAEQRLRKEAQAYCVEQIRVKIENVTKDNSISRKVNGNEEFNSVFESVTRTEASAEITGLKVENYTGADGLLYAFAYVNKYELTGYYNASLTMNLQQLESLLQTARSLETSSDKAKARTQYEQTVPMLAKIEYAQDLLIALDQNANTQKQKTADYRIEIITALARLSQGVYICVQSKEDMFGKNSFLIANKVKSILSKNGCSFTSDMNQADFILKIDASARKIGDPGQIVFCFADVEVELIKKQSNKTLYQEDLKQKGGHTSYDNAAREAFNDAGQKLAEKLLEWVKN